MTAQKDPLKIALRYLKVRPRSIFEVEQKLKWKGIDEEEIQKTIAALVRVQLLDDRKFAALWVESRKALHPSGGRRLFMELRKLGIEKDIIDGVLKPLKSEEYDLALRAAERRLRLYKGLDEETFRRRLSGFLARRGFEYATIVRVLKMISFPSTSH